MSVNKDSCLNLGVGGGQKSGQRVGQEDVQGGDPKTSNSLITRLDISCLKRLRAGAYSRRRQVIMNLLELA